LISNLSEPQPRGEYTQPPIGEHIPENMLKLTLHITKFEYIVLSSAVFLLKAFTNPISALSDIIGSGNQSSPMKATSLYSFLTLFCITIAMPAGHSPQLPNRVLVGVTVPDTPLIQDALDYTRQHTTPGIFNHVMRSWLYGVIISSRVPAFQNVDKEVHAVSTILHDLGWDPSGALITPDKRFDVDGANAAREFLRSKAPSWDSIALHSTPSFAAHKQVEVALTSIGYVI